jgi:glycerate kinase
MPIGEQWQCSLFLTSFWNPPLTMHILIAPDSFKGTCSATKIAQAIAEGVSAAMPEATVDLCPIADGGEGTIDAMMAGAQGVLINEVVASPTGDPISAAFALLDGGVAVVELAAASGLTCVPDHQRHPLALTTLGTGMLIRSASAIADEVVIGIGSSATVDGGIGVLQGLGGTVLLSGGEIAPDGLPPSGFASIESLVLPDDLGKMTVLCDVQSPLLGPTGAAAVYGPQKGATPQDVNCLESHLAHLATIGGGGDVAGGGAAGGVGWMLGHVLGMESKSGIQAILDLLEFDQRLTSADLVITGEGRLDGQTLNGKACMGVAQRARQQGVRTIAVAGCSGEGWESLMLTSGGPLSEAYFLSDMVGQELAMSRPGSSVTSTVEALLKRL